MNKQTSIKSLIIISSIILAGMSLYEWAKQMLWPQITIWQSHLITIFFSTLIGTLAAYWVLRRFRKILIRLSLEVEERKTTERALKESEQKFRTFAEYTYDWETWINPEGEYVYITPACERITRYTPDQYMQDPDLLLKIIHPDDQKAFKQHRSFHLSQEEVMHLDFRIITQDGRERWISHYCQPVYSEDGKWLGRRASNRDITNRKQLIIQLQDMLTEVKTLRGLIPICANCKKIRDDKGYWQLLEYYIEKHAEVRFSHGICPDCARALYPKLYTNELP